MEFNFDVDEFSPDMPDDSQKTGSTKAEKSFYIVHLASYLDDSDRYTRTDKITTEPPLDSTRLLDQVREPIHF